MVGIVTLTVLISFFEPGDAIKLVDPVTCIFESFAIKELRHQLLLNKVPTDRGSRRWDRCAVVPFRHPACAIWQCPVLHPETKYAAAGPLVNRCDLGALALTLST